MAVDNRFKQTTINILAKRAGNLCSNPTCHAITSGPTDNPNDSINIGEAAHIYGANVGSARYDPEMDSMNRSSITNAIWLCSNCHKMVDDDPLRYTAELLFEWQREHELYIARRVGKNVVSIKERYEKRYLERFGRLSYLAERIILEKNAHWEYNLTAEMLRYEMAPIIQGWEALKKGLYIKSIMRIDNNSFIPWILDQLHEINKIVDVLERLMSLEFARVWRDPGVAGSDIDIVNVCRLYAGVCKNALECEERVQFIRIDDIFSKLHELLIGIAGNIIDQARKVPEFLQDLVKKQPTSGLFELKITFELPVDWGERFDIEMKKAIQNLEQTTNSHDTSV